MSSSCLFLCRGAPCPCPFELEIHDCWSHMTVVGQELKLLVHPTAGSKISMNDSTGSLLTDYQSVMVLGCHGADYDSLLRV